MKALSPQDAMFLIMERRRQPMHVAGLQLFTSPAGTGAKFARELVDHARGFQQPERPWNQRLSFRRGFWHWRDDEHFDLDHHFRYISLPQPGRIRELLAYVSHEHSGLMDRSRPLWEMHAIEGLPDNRFAVYSKIHHALFDGMSAMKVARSFFTEDPDIDDSPPLWAMPPRKRSRTAGEINTANPFTALTDAVAANYRVLPGIYRGLKDLFGSADATEVKPYQAPPTIFNQNISASRRFAGDTYELERMKRVAKACSATLNDIALAMCSGALREYLIANNALPDRPLIAMVPVSVASADHDGGNQVAAILANLGTHIADPSIRLKTIIQSTKAAKSRMKEMSRVEQLAYAGAALGAIPLTTVTGFDKIHPPFNVVISNVPGPEKPLYWNGARLDEMYPLSIPIDGQAMNITLNSYTDRMAFGFTACSRRVPSMQRLLDYTEKALADLETAADLN